MIATVETVDVEVKTTVKEKRILISLNEEEATALGVMIGSYSGSADENDPRKVIGSPLWEVLNNCFNFCPGGWYNPIAQKYAKKIGYPGPRIVQDNTV